MNEQDLEPLADRFRRRGFEVKFRPKLEELPDFARCGPGVDMLATNGREIILVQAKLSEDAPEVFVAADMGGEYVRSMIMEAEHLLRLDIHRSAFVIAWASFEAAARDLLKRKKIEADRIPLIELIGTLRREGYIESSQIDRMQYSLNLRNTLVHGVRPEKVPSDLTIFLVSLARELAIAAAKIAEDRPQEMSFRIPGGATIMRGNLEHIPGLREKVERANQILNEVLGPLNTGTSVEWRLSEDDRQRPTVTLTLSDYTGTVTATFAPEEMGDEDPLRSRMTRALSELLGRRSRKQIDIHRRAHPAFDALSEGERMDVLAAVAPLRGKERDRWASDSVRPLEGIPHAFAVRAPNGLLALVTQTHDKGVEIVDIVREDALDQLGKPTTGKGGAA